MSATRRYSPAFHNALANLGNWKVAPSLAFRVMRVWHHISARCEPPEPIIEMTEDGGVRFAWNSEASYACSTPCWYLDLEVYDDGTFEWFYSDRTNGAVDGTQGAREEVLPEAFYVRLEALLECP